MASIKIRTSWFTLLSRGGLFVLIWWVLTDGAASSWWIGVPAVLLAVTVSIALLPPAPFVWSELLRFVPFFLRHSLLGGTDVARRAFQPRMPIAPDLIEYPLRLPPGLPRVFMANVVNLLPGTLSTAFDQHVLKVHILDSGKGFLAELEAVEQNIARMFGSPLQAFDGSK
jgi:multicomponent Na+:H+ antiporter subunit E